MQVADVTLLHEALERSERDHPQKTALVVGSARLTWAEVGRQASQLANLLLGLGVERHDRVVVLLGNSVEAAISVFGILRAGAVLCVVSPETKADKLRYLLNDCRPTALITDHYHQSVVEQVLPDTPSVRQVLVVSGRHGSIGNATLSDYGNALGDAVDTPPNCSSISVDLAAIIYTSGSTGDAKGVMLTHQNMVAAVQSITRYLENREDDVVINVLPLSFDYGLYQWLMVAYFAGTLVLEASFSYPAKVIQLIRAEHVTGLPVVPTMASILARFQADGVRLPGVRYVTNTAAALSDRHLEILQAMCPNARVYSMYGLTECKRFCYLPPAELATRPGSVGKAMPNMEGFVVHPDTGARLPPGDVGELVIRGSQVMKGYWGKPELSREWLKPGAVPGEPWLWTGDLFKTDAEGYFYFVGRKDDIIKSRGEKVSPREVEGIVHALAGVVDVAVVGEADEMLGQAIRIYLTLESEGRYTPQDIKAHCAAHLEGYMVPKYVTFLSELQKTSSGKVKKTDLSSFARDHFLGGDPP